MNRLPFNHNDHDVLRAVSLSKEDLPPSASEFEAVLDRIEEGGKPLRLAAFYIAFAIDLFFERNASKSPFFFFFHTVLKTGIKSFSHLVELVEDGLVATYESIKEEKSDIPLSFICRLILADSSFRYEGMKSFHDYLLSDVMKNLNLEELPRA